MRPSAMEPRDLPERHGVRLLVCLECGLAWVWQDTESGRLRVVRRARLAKPPIHRWDFPLRRGRGRSLNRGVRLRRVLRLAWPRLKLAALVL